MHFLVKIFLGTLLAFTSIILVEKFIPARYFVEFIVAIGLILLFQIWAVFIISWFEQENDKGEDG